MDGFLGVGKVLRDRWFDSRGNEIGVWNCKKVLIC